MTTLLELYENGVISYLVKNRIVSTTMLAYIEYFKEYSNHRKEGMSYRGAVRTLSVKHGVSETTIKKGIRIVKAAEADQQSKRMPALTPTVLVPHRDENVLRAIAS